MVVSEENGTISLAHAGSIERDITPDYLRERLSELLRSYVPPAALPTPIAQPGAENERPMSSPKLERAGDPGLNPGG